MSDLPTPTIDLTDEELEAADIEYRDYNEADTFVVSGPLPGGSGPGRPFDSGDEAEVWWTEKYGGGRRIREAEIVSLRWAARVKKPVGNPGVRE